MFVAKLSNVLSTFMQYGYEYSYTTSTSGDPTGFLMANLLFLLCCCVGWVVIMGAISYLVYQDAKKNDVSNPILWAVLTFFLTWIGALLYFLIGRSAKK